MAGNFPVIFRSHHLYAAADLHCNENVFNAGKVFAQLLTIWPLARSSSEGRPPHFWAALSSPKFASYFECLKGNFFGSLSGHHVNKMA